MKVAKLYSHLNGYEWLQYHKPGLWKELLTVIEGVDADQHKTKISKEKTKAGEILYSPADINKDFHTQLNKFGWKEGRFNYWVTDDQDLIRKTLPMTQEEQKKEIIDTGRKPILSYNQTDFIKDQVAIEVQFGKYAFIAYDHFVKHLSFYVGNKIDLGIEILPMKIMQAKMSSGPGYYEGALYDLVRQGRGVPAVPLVILGVIPDSMGDGMAEITV